MKQRAAVTFVIAAALGATIWLVSPWVTGHNEPWDADGIYYHVALAVAGFIAGAISPTPLWAHYLGSIFGQLGYELLFLPVGPLILIGVGFLLVFCLLFVAAAFVAAQARAFLGLRKTHV